MRYGLLSDVHANLPALQVVLAELDRQAVDLIVCAGDLVGYGARPNECIALLAERGALCVAGNHDLIAMGDLSTERAGPTARRTLAWTTTVLTAASRDYLRALPRTRRVGDLLVAHGSPDDPEEYVTTPEQADVLLQRLPAAAGATAPQTLVLGHTHHPWAYGSQSGTLLRRGAGTVRLDPHEDHLLNPGSVGQSRERAVVARYCVVDTVASTATFRGVPYDVAGWQAELVRAGLPADSFQLRPPVIQRARGVAGRARRRLQGRPAPSI